MTEIEKIAAAIEGQIAVANETNSDFITLTKGKGKKILEILNKQETSNTGRARLFQCEKCGYGFDDIFLTDEHNFDIEPRYSLYLVILLL